MGKPNIPNLDAFYNAGIDPKTRLPIKMAQCSKLKEGIKKTLRIIDEQDAVNRYTWYNIPCDLSSQEIERMLYYKGQLCFFYLEDLDEFYFMPYALDGTLDVYGRFNHVHPVPFSIGEKDDNKKGNKALMDYFSNLKLKVNYGLKSPMIEDITNGCVLLHDYTKQLSQNIQSRQILQEPILDVMSDIIPYSKTALLLGTGVRGVRVSNEDEANNVDIGSTQMEEGALNSKPLIPVVGSIEFQDLTNGNIAKVDEYFMALQSLDNYRLSCYGLDNGGLFDKKAQMTVNETSLMGGQVGLVLQDGLKIRQNFCNIVNNIYGIGIWCEINENVSQIDNNQDGKVYDTDEEGYSSGVEREEGGTDNERQD